MLFMTYHTPTDINRIIPRGVVKISLDITLTNENMKNMIRTRIKHPKLFE
jgi:hypothetical protein